MKRFSLIFTCYLEKYLFRNFVGTLINCIGHLLTLCVYAHKKVRKKYKIQSCINLRMTFDILTWVATVQPTGAQNLISSHLIFLSSSAVIPRSLFNQFKYNLSTFMPLFTSRPTDFLPSAHFTWIVDF